MNDYDDIDYAQTHCDMRICHKPGKCEFCDERPEIQAKRVERHVRFTGEAEPHWWRPCPADAARGDSHEAWGGNQPVGDGVPPEEKERLSAKQSTSSRILYGDVQAWPRNVGEPFDRNIIPGDKEVPKSFSGKGRMIRESFLKNSLIQKILSWIRRD